MSMQRSGFGFLSLFVLSLPTLFEVGCVAWYPSETRGTAPYNRPYQVGNITYRPISFDDSYIRVGNASWYGPGFHGRKTSNGEVFNQNDVTAASKILPLPSLAEVQNLENGRSIIVRVNDRGPFLRNRIIDLSKRAAELLGYEKKGVVRVRVRYIGPASPRRKG